MQLINAGLLLHEIEGRVELLRTRSRYKISTLKVHKNALHNIETSRMSVVNDINLLKLIKPKTGCILKRIKKLLMHNVDF